MDHSINGSGIKSDNENELNPEMASKLKSPRKKQLPTKNFMNPTISAAIKAASSPKKKILGERNETLDAVEQVRVQRSSGFGSKPVRFPVVDSDDDVEKDFVGKPCLQPYDPVKNYLSPRPKFLRYNPDRRRKILNLQETDEDRVKISTYFDADVPPVSELQDSCSHQESCTTQDVNGEEDEDESDEESESESYDDEEEMVEFGEDKWFSVKGFFKFLFVVIAVVLMTQAICSMNTPSPSETLDSVCGFNRSVNHVYDLKFSEVGYGMIREPVLLVERLKEEDGKQDVFEPIEEYVEVQNAQTDDVHQDEAEDDHSNAIQDELLQEEEIKDSEVEEFSSEVVETDYVETGTVDEVHEDGATDEDGTDAIEKNDQMATDGVEKELDDAKTNDGLIRFSGFNLTVAILIGHMLILTSFGAIYRSRCKKVVKKEGFKDLEPSTNPQAVKEEKKLVTNEASLTVPPHQREIVTETKRVQIPSVEVLGEFVFDEEITSNMSPEIQTPAVSSSQTETSQTVKKQRRKNAEVVTPSSVSVRRSSRLKTRASVMSP